MKKLTTSISTAFSNRRGFLKTLSAASLLPLTTAVAKTDTPKALNAFKSPPLDSGRRDGDTVSFDLTLDSHKTRFFKGLDTATLGINQSYLGPTLRVKRGDNVRIKIKNQIGLPSTLHWHGMILPAEMDGGPHQEIKHGGEWTAQYKIRQQASTLWYHSHQMHQTGIQVYLGLAGMLIIDDEGSQQLGLPQEYGVDDIPCTIQDRRFKRDASLIYLESMHDRMMGMSGRNFLINGVATPTLKAERSLLRLRLHNGSNARLYYLTFSDDRDFHVIASDGGFLPEPVTVNSLRLAVGERMEILVDVSDKKVIELQGLQRGNARFKLMSIDASEVQPSTHKVPEKLRKLTAVPDPEAAVTTRQFELEMGRGGFRINGKSMDPERIDFEVKRNSTEIWEVSNKSPMPHPFHVHNVQFRILDRDGKKPSKIESGLKDTVLVHRGEVVRLVMAFPEYSDAKTPYMFHCHILEHEDLGMMGQFTVV